MSLGARVERAVRFVVHNWPLKLAAIALATLLYAGLVASQDSSVFPGPVPVSAINKPPGTVVTNELRDLDQIRYIAPLEVGRLLADDFEATVDLSNVEPGRPARQRPRRGHRRGPAGDRPRLPAPLDPGRARRARRPSRSRSRCSARPPPDGVDVGEVSFEPTEVTVTGPARP